MYHALGYIIQQALYSSVNRSMYLSSTQCLFHHRLQLVQISGARSHQADHKCYLAVYASCLPPQSSLRTSKYCWSSSAAPWLSSDRWSSAAPRLYTACWLSTTWQRPSNTGPWCLNPVPLMTAYEHVAPLSCYDVPNFDDSGETSLISVPDGMCTEFSCAQYISQKLKKKARQHRDWIRDYVLG